MDTPNLTLPPHHEGFPAILFGLECQTTAIVLLELINAGVAIKLLCLPGRPAIPLLRTPHRTSLPMAGSSSQLRSVTEIARTTGVDVWRVGDLNSADVREALQAVPADLVVVACFDRLLPAHLYENRRFGGVNLHPSLLPDKRGPDPLFWIFRNDDDRVGATIHRLTDDFDAGDILAQEAFPKPDGITEDELDALLSQLGTRLVVETISRAVANTSEPTQQTAQEATWAPFPSPSDYVIDRSMGARHAFNFIRGVSERSHPVLVEIDGKHFPVLEVYGWYEPDDPPASLPDQAQVIEFAHGWLALALSNKSG